MDAEADDPILEALLDALERGESTDRPALGEELVGRRDSIESLKAAAREYRRRFPGSAREGPVPHLAAGTRLGDFEVEALVGRGTGGAVYRARQLSLGLRPVALKVSRARERAPHEIAARPEREALALAELHHPSLAEVYGFGVEQGLSFLAMRLVEGPTLRELIRMLRPTPPSRSSLELLRGAVRWIAQVAEGLAAVHAAGLVHRDVKPANVIVERAGAGEGELPRGRAVLVDFDLARTPSSGGALGVGGASATEAYAPPEQLMGGEVGPPADVFALGVTLHDLLLACEPGERVPAALGLAPPVGLDRDLAAVLVHATDPDPRWRYPDAGAMARDLSAWLAGEPVSVRRGSRRERSARWWRVRRARIARNALYLLGLLALATAGTRLLQDARQARRARAAHERGDVQTLVSASDALFPPWRGLLLPGEVCIALSGDGAGDTNRRLALHAAAQDRDGALVLAATRVGERGVLAEPVALRFLALELERELGASTGMHSHVSLPLLFAMRLGFERPPVGARELETCDGMRAVLRGAWHDAALSGEARLAVASALAGFGAPDDVELLLEWTLSHAPGSEERRLGGFGVERAIRRLHRGGQASDLDLARLRALLEPELARVLATWPDPDAAGADAARFIGREPALVAAALALAERDRRGSSELRARLPLAWIERLRAGWLPQWLPGRLLAACAPEEMDALSLVQPENDRARATSIGELCGLACRVDLAPLLRARWAAAAPDPEQALAIGASFDAGLERGRARARGECPGEEPDAETLLGAPFDAGPPLEERATARGAPEPGVLADWHFRAEPTAFQDRALGVRFVASSPWRAEEGDRCVRAARFGESRIELRFEAPEERLAADPQLALEQIAAARQAFPFEGKAYVDVHLDGELIGTLLVEDKSYHLGYLAIPSSRLSPGEHVIVLRLGLWTTTTYRLARATLIRQD